MSSYPPVPQRKNCNCSDPCISTDDVYYAGPNLPNSGVNTSDLLTEVIEKLDAIYAVPTLQRVTEMGNYTTLPIIADSFVKIGGDGDNILLDDGTVLPIGDLPSNTQTLAETLVLGNNTGGTDILLNDADSLYLENGSYIKKGRYDFGAAGGVSRICSIGYEDMWQAGFRHVFDANGFIRNSTNCFNVIPYIDSDVTRRYKIGSIWTLDDLTNYICTDATEGAAVWELYKEIPAPLGYTPVNKAGDTMLGNLILNADPGTALQAATKQYVDNIVSGINFHPPVVVATDVPLVATYDNGVDGVGATLTGPSVGVLSIDGEFPAYLDRILVWQQADPIQNGVYDLTTVGDSVTVYQLTRSSDADNSPPGEIHYGDYTLVLSGDTNGGFGFICNTPGTIDIGITPITYIQFNAAQAVTAGYGLQEAVSNVISIDPAVTQEKITLTTTGSGAATLVSNTLNIPTIGIVSATETGVVNNTSLQELGGVDKTINGVRVGRGNISAAVSENTAVGYQALQSVTHATGFEGWYNSAFGDSALKGLTTGYANNAFGEWALIACTIGTFNTAVGGSTLSTLLSGTQNVAIGVNALRYSIIGNKNTAVGTGALYRNTGSFNTAIGNLAGGDVTSSGSNNILIGFQAGSNISIGTNNLLIENITNPSITSGSFNIVLNPKQKSGVTTGSYNTIIGAFDGTFPSAMANNVILADGQGNIRFRTTDTGLTTVPGQTNALIDGDTTNKSIITKEYLTSYTTTQLAGKMNNPSLTASYIPKALTATTIGNSRLLDTGTYLGIGTVNAPTKDITLGNQANREIGIELSNSTTIGRNLMIAAGNTINYQLNTNFLPLSQSLKAYEGIDADSNGNVWVCEADSNGIYKQTGGVGNFIVHDTTNSYPRKLTVAPNGDIYISTWAGGTPTVRVQVGGVGVWNTVTVVGIVGSGQGDFCSAANGDIYFCTNSTGQIYKRTGGIGNFVSLAQSSLSWTGLAYHFNGDVYACAAGADIYKQTGGVGNFVGLGVTSRNWSGITIAPNGNIYASVANGDIYMQTNGIGSFNQLNQTSRNWSGLAANINGNIYAIVYSAGSDIYMQNNSGVGTANLQGGTLKLTSGTGKGTGASDIELYTGQVLASGTDMQTSTLRAKINNTGLMTLPSVTNALIEADTTGKAVVTKEYVNNRLVVETTSGYTLTNADSGGIIIFKTTAAQTLTIPTGLADGFECTFVTLSGVTLTVVSTGNTLNNATSTTMLPQLSFTLKRMLAANTYIVAGSL